VDFVALFISREGGHIVRLNGVLLLLLFIAELALEA